MGLKRTDEFRAYGVLIALTSEPQACQDICRLCRNSSSRSLATKKFALNVSWKCGHV